MNKHLLTVLPSNNVIEVDEVSSLFTHLKKNGFKVKSTCGGCASCGQCIVVVTAGENHLNPIPFEEKQLLGNVFFMTKERLSCQTYIHGNVTVDISEHLKEKAPIKKAPIKVRKKEEVAQIIEEKENNIVERNINKPKRVGGGRRPKAFKYKDDINNKE